MKMYKYSSIDQLRNVVATVKQGTFYIGKDNNNEPLYDTSKPLPTLNFKGTVKIHGTNASIAFNGVDYYAQSRERILSLESDNAGFYVYAHKNKDYFEQKLSEIKQSTGFDNIVVYGEWCGQGIQKSVGVSELPKMFVVFDVVGINNNDDKKYYLDDMVSEFSNGELSVYNTNNFITFSVDIDFNSPELSVNHIIDLTTSVENECPVAKYFGVSGVGEGIVFQTYFNGNKIRFKSKGEKHSISKVKKLVSVDPEKIASVQNFVEYAVTPNRLEQGINYFKENNITLDITNMGQYIKWVSGDIIKEESDVLISNNLGYKDVGGKVANVAKNYFMDQLSKF